MTSNKTTKKILDFFCKKVVWMDDEYTLGGIILTFIGLMAFVLLCGFLEGLG